MVLHTIFGILIINFIATALGGHHGWWCYDEEKPCGPSHWNGTCNSGKAQSPIDIITTPPSKTKGTWNLKASPDYCHGNGSFNMQNNGHSVELYLKNEDKKLFNFCCEVSKDEYSLDHVHVYWSQINGSGTEHAIDGKIFDLEIQLIHKPMKRDTQHKKIKHKVKESHKSEEKYIQSVFTFLFEIDESGPDNAALEPIVKILIKINGTAPEKLGGITKYSTIDFLKLVPTDKSAYQYEGSTTAPPCAENVLWTVYKSIGKISKGQISQFRSLVMPDMQPISKISRPRQNLGDRKIEHGSLDIKC